MVEVLTLDTPELGDRSYLIHDGEQAIVVDPQRDTDRVLELASAAGVKIRCVAETHIHNDYLSGGPDLSQRLGAPYLVGAADQVEFPRQSVHPGDLVAVGTMHLQALATPGHTPTHLAYLLSSDGREQAVFSGGSLLYGALGRTDLVSASRSAELARAQLRSAHGLLALEDELRLYPTHGFGSFCASAVASEVGAQGTIGDERRGNPAAAARDEEAFVRDLLGGYTAYPTYYAHMGPGNRSGAAAPDLTLPPALGLAEVGQRIRQRQWVIDLRTRLAFGADHVRGTLNFPSGLHLATYVGWVVPWKAPLSIVGSAQEEVLRARRDLSRIGVDWLAGWCPTPLAELEAELGRSSYQVTDFAGLARAMSSGAVQVLDARRPDEWRQGHVRGSINIHLPDLPARLAELPRHPTWVHCTAGYRASIAASLLDREGWEVVLVDDDFGRAPETGLPLELPAS
ncbi:MAG: MBL fold metallo-hydrolase [Candidatus Dormibacteria bacterium]